MLSSISEEDGVYRQDLYNTFKDITGYNYDQVTRKIIKNAKQDQEDQVLCSYMAQRIINFIHPALTNFTKYSKNSDNIVGLKSMHNIKGIGALWRNNFHHDCGLHDAPGWCIRQIREDEWCHRYLNNLWRFVDDSYRHSIGGFTRREKNKMTKVDEQRSIVMNQGNKKKNWAENLDRKINPQNYAEEEENTE